MPTNRLIQHGSGGRTARQPLVFHVARWRCTHTFLTSIPAKPRSQVFGGTHARSQGWDAKPLGSLKFIFGESTKS